MDLLHPNGRCSCGGEGTCEWCVRYNVPEGRAIIVCGGRDFTGTRDSLAWLLACLAVFKAQHGVTIVREGGARGADHLGAEAAKTVGLTVDTMPADWQRYGKRAGPIRNAAMLAKEPRPVAVLALPGDRGTADMVRQAKRAGIEVRRYEPPAN